MYSRTAVGNVEECRTEVEIRDKSNELVAIVYEDYKGWQTNFFGNVAQPRPIELEISVEKAINDLSHYVNRRGDNPPNGMTAAGLSLWLLEKVDGSILGMT